MMILASISFTETVKSVSMVAIEEGDSNSAFFQLTEVQAHSPWDPCCHIQLQELAIESHLHETDVQPVIKWWN